MNKTYKIVAEAARVEYIKDSDKVFLVFEVVDESFKKRIKDDWMQDIDLEIINRSLMEKKDPDANL